MYIMCVCLFSALSRRVGALQISIIIIIWAPTKKCSLADSFLDPYGVLVNTAVVEERMS